MNYSQYFEFGKRPDGNLFVRLKDESPQELQDLIRAIHFDHFFGCFANDWIYEQIWDAFEAVEEDPENYTVEADIYNHDLTQWLADCGNQFAIEYCNEAFEHLCDPLDVITLISQAQFLAKLRIHESIEQFLDNQRED